MSKYAPLSEFLNTISQDTDDINLPFRKIEVVLGFKLPASARKYNAWWANPGNEQDHPYAQSWLQAGWKVAGIDFQNESVTFTRI